MLNSRLLAPILMLAILCTTASAEVRVQVFLGTAEIRKNGEWRPVEPGETLPAEATLRTGEESRLQILLPDDSFARLLEKSKCKVVETDEGKKPPAVRLGLDSGSLILSVVSSKRRPKISLPDESAVEGKGLFSIAVVDEENSRVSVLKGEACASPENGEGEKVCLKTEQELAIAKGKPAAPGKISEEALAVWKAQKFLPTSDEPKLFLKILQPEENKNLDESNVYVVGKTLPGAQVRVNGKPVKVKDNGSFNGTIGLFEGENQLVFSATSPEGETLSAVRTVHLDSTPPLLMVSQPIDNFDPSIIGNCDANQCAIQIFGLTEPGVLLNINGLDASRFISDDGSFLIQDFPINLNESVLTIYAQDSFQRRTFEILHIEPPQDTDGDGIPDFMDGD